MVGRTYCWQGRVWRVIARWRDGGRSGDPYSAVCDECGSILFPAINSRGWVPICRCTGDPIEFNPGRRQHGTAPRNVLIEDVETGQRVVRPFRGLRVHHGAVEHTYPLTEQT